MATIDGDQFGNFIFGTPDNDLIRGLAGNDFLLGAEGDDTLEGGDDNDDLAGGVGADTLDGGNGNDTLSGEDSFLGAEADTLTGGAGADRFTWRVGATGSTAVATDRVTDFEAGDTLQLLLDFGSQSRLVYRGALGSAPTVGAALAFGGDGFIDVFHFTSGGDTYVIADSDDDGVYDADDFTVVLTGIQALTRTSFGTTDFVTAGTNGNNVINGTAAIDTIFGLGGNDVINGFGGNDAIEGGAGADVLDGGDGNDRVEGGLGNDVINGGAGRDNLVGEEGNDVVNGGIGNDNVSGGDGNDVVNGGDGNDTVDGDEGNDVLHGDAGDDTIFALDGNDTAFGDAGEDEMYGGEGNDTLNGGADDDELEGEEGADILTGGGGDDRFNFFTNAFQPDSVFSARDRVTDFEGAGVEGGDVMELDGDEYAFSGRIANNLGVGAALAGGGDGVTQLFYYWSGATTILIADDNDNGIIDSSDFAVTFNGNLDFTTGDFISTSFVQVGTPGDDAIEGTEDGERIFGVGGNDVINGNAGDDELHGGDGNDVIDTGFGFDSAFGDDGDDTITITEYGSASGGAGNDTLFGSDADFAFSYLSGEDGNDILVSGLGGGVLDGGAGDDRLEGSSAGEAMYGGDGVDTFVFGAEWGFDNIGDFTEGEKIDLSGSGLTFADLLIEDLFGFATTITSSAGTIQLDNVDWTTITEDDFIFAPAPAAPPPDGGVLV
jgi:Ca2+-binding RTX toxin-like protein